MLLFLCSLLWFAAPLRAQTTDAPSVDGGVSEESPSGAPGAAPASPEGKEDGGAAAPEGAEPAASPAVDTGPVEVPPDGEAAPAVDVPPAVAPAENAAVDSKEDQSKENESQALPFDKKRAPTPVGTVRPVHDDDGAEKTVSDEKRATEREDFSLRALRLSAAGGYALRLSSDERSHGGAASLSVGLPVFAGFGVAGETLFLGWGPSEQRAAPLGFVGGAGLLTYVFDDSASTALIGVGPLVGYALELEEDGSFTTGLHAGAMFSFGLRFAVAPTVAAEIGIRAPFILYGPEGFVFRVPLTPSTSTTPGLFESQFILTLGLTFDPFLFFDLFSKGADPLPLVVPFMAAASDP